jgi:hypothetical protein
MSQIGLSEIIFSAINIFRKLSKNGLLIASTCCRYRLRAAIARGSRYDDGPKISANNDSAGPTFCPPTSSGISARRSFASATLKLMKPAPLAAAAKRCRRYALVNSFKTPVPRKPSMYRLSFASASPAREIATGCGVSIARSAAAARASAADAVAMSWCRPASLRARRASGFACAAVSQ